MSEFFKGLVESLKEYEEDTKNEPGFDAKTIPEIKIYYLLIQSAFDPEQKNILIAHRQFIEELDVQKFEYFSEILRENKFFQNLSALRCDAVSGDFNIEAPKLTYLKISTEQKNAHIHLEGLPHLSRLEIDCGLFFNFQSERQQYPVITSIENKDLTELYITNTRSLDFIETLLINSPNLKFLHLHQTSVPVEDLQKLGHRFANLQIRKTVECDYPIHKILKLHKILAGFLPSESEEVKNLKVILSLCDFQLMKLIQAGGPGIDARDPSAVYQSAHKSVQHKQYAVGSGVVRFTGESPEEIGLRNCLIEAFAWGGVDSVRDPSGKLKVFLTEQSARKALGSSWRHEFLYEKYQQLLELQTALDSAVDKIKIDELAACDDLLAALNKIKKFLEDKNEDYKTEFFNKAKKTTTKKDFYERITNSIAKVESYKRDLILREAGNSHVAAYPPNNPTYNRAY